MEEPLLVVVVPVYNSENHIERCIKSIQDQTYKNLEIVIVDDGSGDKSPQICMELAESDPRIKMIRLPENKGVVAARNAGIDYVIRTKAEFITFVDSDDWIESDLYRQLAEEIGECDVAIEGWVSIDSNSVDTAGFPWARIDSNLSPSTHIQKSPVERGIYSDRGMERIWDSMFVGGGIYSYVWDKLYKVDILGQIYKLLGDEVSGFEDGIFVQNCLLNCKSVRVTDVGGYHYCQHEDSLFRRTMLHSTRGFKMLGLYYDALLKVYSAHYYKKELLKRLYNDIFIYAKLILHSTMDIKLGDHFYYPYFGRLDGKKVILYGAGEVGRAYRREIKTEKEVELVLWVDKNYTSKGEDVCSPGMISEVTYDHIIIGVFSEDTYVEIKEELLNMGVEENKLLWSKTKRFSLSIP